MAKVRADDKIKAHATYNHLQLLKAALTEAESPVLKLCQFSKVEIQLALRACCKFWIVRDQDEALRFFRG